MFNLFSDKSFLLPGMPHVAMLSPFWGKRPDHPNNPSRGWLDEYMKSSPEFFRMTSLQDADVAVLPAPWSRIIRSVPARTLAGEFAAAARAGGKETVVFFNSDSTEKVALDGSVVFRTSMYRSRREPTEFAIPAWSEDFVKRYLDGRLSIRKKVDRPTVGFCGFVAPLLGSMARNFARWGAGLVGRRRGATNPFVTPGHAIRLKAMTLLSGDPDLRTNFVRRSSFFQTEATNGPPGKQSDKLRMEFVRNIVDSDYTLCVRGAGNFSYRLYETLSCGRIPVFVDTDCVLPYESIIDWKRYCVYIDEKDIAHIGDRVAEFHSSLSPAQFEDLQWSCRRLWEEYISPAGFFRNIHQHFAIRALTR